MVSGGVGADSSRHASEDKYNFLFYEWSDRCSFFFFLSPLEARVAAGETSLKLCEQVLSSCLLLSPPPPAASVRLSGRPGSLCSSSTAAASRETTAASRCARHAGTRFTHGFQNKSTHRVRRGNALASWSRSGQKGHVRFSMLFFDFFLCHSFCFLFF